MRDLSRKEREPGSRPLVDPANGLVPYGSPDPTGFGEGCVV